MSRAPQATLRRFRESDLPSILRLIHRTIDDSYRGVYPPRALQWFKEHHSREQILARHHQGEVLVVELGGRVIATGSVVDGAISGVFTDPAFQGRGHGGALMRELEDRARAAGCRQTVLNVSLPSRRFYEHLGYSLEECSRDLGDGQRLDYWRARKDLPAQAPRRPGSDW